MRRGVERAKERASRGSPRSARAAAPPAAPPAAPEPATSDLASLRDALAAVDADLVALLATRQQLVQQVGAHKRAMGVAVLDPAREAAVVRRAAELARERGLPADSVRELFRRIMALARDTQLGDGVETPRNAALDTRTPS